MKYFFRLRACIECIVTQWRIMVNIKKVKVTKKCVIKKPLNFKDYKNCLKGT